LNHLVPFIGSPSPCGVAGAVVGRWERSALAEHEAEGEGEEEEGEGEGEGSAGEGVASPAPAAEPPSSAPSTSLDAGPGDAAPAPAAPGSGVAEIARRTAIGRAAKRIIDAGRQRFLGSLFASVDLLQYCDPTDSLENVLLIASQ
jgi:hypothetical protein